jgi:glycosyltransferase involved in cell wall biosynthesis
MNLPRPRVDTCAPDPSSSALPRVRVIIPAYRGRRWIEAAITSALDQSGVCVVVVVVDDGCPDNTGDVVASLARPEVTLIRQANGGVGAARLTGFEFGSKTEEFIVLLDQDDRLRPGAIALMAQRLLADPALVAVIGHPTFLDEFGTTMKATDYLAARTREHEGKSQLTLEAMLYRCCANTPGQALLRCSALDAAGGLNALLAPSDDWDMWLRLLEVGPISIVEETTVAVTRHGGNVSLRRAQMRRAEMLVRTAALRRAGTRRARRNVLRAFRRSETDWAAVTLVAAVDRSHRIPRVRERVVLTALAHAAWACLGLRSHRLLDRFQHRHSGTTS